MPTRSFAAHQRAGTCGSRGCIRCRPLGLGKSDGRRGSQRGNGGRGRKDKRAMESIWADPKRQLASSR
eukprot:5522134-Pyramimonas_sp.AAC.1